MRSGVWLCLTADHGYVKFTARKFVQIKTKGENMVNKKQTFRGYFKNADYADPAVFLQQGEQTRLTKEILAVAQLFNNCKDISTLQEIYQWMRSNLSSPTSDDADKFGRTAHEIINSRAATGCTDCGLVFAVLARAKGIPAVFVQSAKINWIKAVKKNGEKAGPVCGHILVEVHIKGQWCLVDSAYGVLYCDYDVGNFCLPGGYYVFAKSTEVWDTGVKNSEENKRVMTRLFADFDVSQYQKPTYKKTRL